MQSRMTEDQPVVSTPWADVPAETTNAKLQQQWSEIAGSDALAFAARATPKVESALSQECEAIRGTKDLLNNVEHKQKEHVAKTEMGL